jgi:hydroxyacylglutathione hydrolase
MYPGRIYINGDPNVFAISIERLVAFTRDKLIAHVLGTHIEQKSPYTDYAVGTHYAPVEMALGQGRGELLEMTRVRDVDGKIVMRANRTFSVCGEYPNCDPVNL